MALALEQFVKRLEESGLVAATALQEFLPPRAAPRDAEELAKLLVRRKCLTKFQAEEVYRGKGKLLRLGNYLLLEKIGAGGMGQVFKARHQRMDRLVAIKLLPAAVMNDKDAIARFEREVKAVARLSHPNIVAAHDSDCAENVHFLVMELVDGTDLAALVRKNGALPVDHAIDYVMQAAKGLAAAHAQGIVHRDVKPANLLVDRNGVVKVLDLGLARLHTDGDGGTLTDLTSTGTIMGTIDYMAPEQALNTKAADARSDIYSLGCSLYYLLTATAIYDGETFMRKLLMHREHPVPSLRTLRPEVDLQLDMVFQVMVSKDPLARYPSMNEVVVELERCRASRAAMRSGEESTINFTADSLSFLRNDAANTTNRSLQVTKAMPVPRSTARTQLIALAAAVALLGIAALATVIVMLQTKDGTLTVEIDQPDAIVKVLDAEGKVEVTQPGAAGTVAISVDPGKHRLKIGKDGFAVFAKDFEVESGGSRTISAKLVPLVAKAEEKPDSKAVATTGLAKPWPDDAIAQGKKRFKFYGEHLTWTEARRKCEALKGRLASVHSTEQNELLQNLMKGTAFGGAWLGGNDLEKEGRWVWSDGSVINYSNWDQKQPNDSGPSGEDYLLLLHRRKSGVWWDQPDTSGWGLPAGFKVGFICEWDDEPAAADSAKAEPPPVAAEQKAVASSSPWPGDAVAHGKKHYKLFAEHLTWQDARRKCESMNGRLAKIWTREDNEILMKTMAGGAVNGAWVGASDEDKEGKWTWRDGSALNYSNWDAGQPNDLGAGEDYLLLVHKFNPGIWWDQPNTAGQGFPPGWKVGFICEWDDESPSVRTAKQ
jgi:serine/threonine protein kinase